MLGRKTLAVSPRRRARTKRPTACAKYSGVETLVANTPTASRGTSTPSDTIRTATIQRSVDRWNSPIRRLACGSSESTTVAGSPVIRLSSTAYARAVAWSEAMTSPPASGISRRLTVNRSLAARRTAPIHSPAGSSAVRQAWAVTSAVDGSPSRTASSAPALVRHRISPE